MTGVGLALAQQEQGMMGMRQPGQVGPAWKEGVGPLFCFWVPPPARPHLQSENSTTGSKSAQ